VIVLTMLATAGAVAGLLVGASWHTGAVARGYRWLAAAVGFWLAGLIITMLAGPFGSTAGTLSLADAPALLGLATAAAGVMVLAEDKRNDTGPVLRHGRRAARHRLGGLLQHGVPQVR
jgi:hypothetical protein